MKYELSTEHHIHIHHHSDDSGAHQKLDKIIALLGRLMSKSDEIKAVLDAVDAATNEVAKDLQELRDRPLTGLDEAEAQAVKDRLAALQARLEVMGTEGTVVPPGGGIA